MVDDRLLELHFGLWELQRWDDLRSPAFKSWIEDFVNQACPEGESYQDLFERAKVFWQGLIDKKSLCVFVVTHSGFIRALLTYLLEIPLEKSLCLGLDFGSVTKVHLRQNVPIVDYVNR